ncbi:Conserved_hypothetical protein [Hexamita inflata]|uniref:HTH myb-type domain-containing protein n=1 Tax=Hexamita inflata TaxID=28002 RepID=A0AA86U2X1_9EUKA|nr:Conserved hypothetical protein [Hexamita inflata]
MQQNSLQSEAAKKRENAHWSDEEKQLFYELYQKHKKQFRMYEQHFPNRSYNQIKCFYYNIQNRNKSKQQSTESVSTTQTQSHYDQVSIDQVSNELFTIEPNLYRVPSQDFAKSEYGYRSSSACESFSNNSSMGDLFPTMPTPGLGALINSKSNTTSSSNVLLNSMPQKNNLFQKSTGRQQLNEILETCDFEEFQDL